MFFFVTSVVSIYHVNKTLAYPDNCTEFHEQNPNGKSKILNLVKNQVLCLDASYIMASKSKFNVYAAFQTYNTSNNTWYWDRKEKVENPLVILGSYYQPDNEYLDPVSMIVCADKTCSIQILEVDATFDYTVNQTEGGVANIFRHVRKSYLFTKSEGSITANVRLTKVKNTKSIETTVEQSRVFFSFPTLSRINYSHSENSRFYYSYAKKWDDEYTNKTNGTIADTKTSFMYVEEKDSYKPTPDKNGNYDEAMTCNFSWAKSENKPNKASEPTEFFFPEVSGPLPEDNGIYYAKDIKEPSKGLSGWAIFTIIIVVLAVIGIIVGIVFWWRRKNQKYETI
ncbi:hypothetical protein TVAG_245240 [Trichomonas vaginalis G3]|uniref:Uncharacterized protein n=1 Tax=Trichomonas vaginalis (strain ATCC PRA-98 / G3) TaxID=412133 RepID=A2FPE7_TRIV3|nr:glycoprotein 38 family [Trichomonas vaginalis G3]EAX93220.1 hypothetical protein TVAG_245240 [Trichomonas vaginalis G3]KAI5539468.1 glycoprotein 38 family [Trichomonas vaginalis G3]|eukprot:XP_001306150.1 hypothetical protein [Trichomonas vaginalis G3]